MKRSILEIALVGGVIATLGYFHEKLNLMNSTHSRKDREISRLESDLAKAKFLLGADRKERDARIGRLQERLAQLTRALQEMEKKLSTQNHHLGEVRKALEQVTLQKEEVTRDLRELREEEGKWGSVAKNAALVADKIKEQEEALNRLKVSLLEDKEHLRKALLLPSVQLNGPDTVGSGTLVYSGPARKGPGYETFVFTSYHVVRDIFADIPEDKEKVVEVTVYLPEGKKDFKADLVAQETRIDLAILKLRSKARIPYTASLATPEELKNLDVFTKVVAVGCPLGNDPIPTEGVVTDLQNRIGGANYWMINAPTYLGNSGGGVFLADSRHLVGVFSKIFTHGKFNPAVVPHMGLCTPLPDILKWLEKTPYSFLAGRPKNDLARGDASGL
ncbi:MAG TPA: hypothetical protein ENJ97_04195 [Planctomycetes bacterium]|nr:hypothetical protein [Planctomycetota bacterium]